MGVPSDGPATEQDAGSGEEKPDGCQDLEVEGGEELKAAWGSLRSAWPGTAHSPEQKGELGQYSLEGRPVSLSPSHPLSSHRHRPQQSPRASPQNLHRTGELHSTLRPPAEVWEPDWHLLSGHQSSTLSSASATQPVGEVPVEFSLGPPGGEDRVPKDTDEAVAWWPWLSWLSSSSVHWARCRHYSGVLILTDPMTLFGLPSGSPSPGHTISSS